MAEAGEIPEESQVQANAEYGEDDGHQVQYALVRRRFIVPQAPGARNHLKDAQ